MDDSNGLIYAHILGPNNKELTWDDVDTWSPDHGIIWLHLDINNAHALSWLKKKSGLSRVVQEALLEQGTRPRNILFNEGTLAILRGVNCNPGEDPEDMVALRMFITDQRIITIRRQRVMAVTDTHKAILSGEKPAASGDFFIMIIDRLSERIAEIITDIEDQVAQVEDTIVTAETVTLRPQLAQLRRQSISIRRYIAPQRDMLARMMHEKITWLTEVDKIMLREIAEQTARFVDDIDATRERALIAQEELNNRISEQMNKAMYTMSIVAAVFLPLGLITGLLGINVGGIPGGDNQWAFLIVTLFLVTIAITLIIWFKKIKWL
ncbi:MAG: zinc transporter ZntB [Desulfobacteraceae bacterium]|jgi:zinc transporter